MTPRERALAIVISGSAATLAAAHSLTWAWGAVGVGATVVLAFLVAPQSVRHQLAPLAVLLGVVGIVGAVRLVVRA